MDVNELIEVLKKQLWKKRYVIIFDDIWDIKVWNVMKYAFPNHDCGSRIMFTTRLKDDFAACSNHTHHLQPLKEQEAWKLFCIKAFGPNDSSGCPEDLEDLSHKILTKCDGLPLGIVMIGSLLAKKDRTVSEWNNVHDSVGAEMRNNNNLYDIRKILLLSINDLPYHLKYCFLYLSMFPKNYLIKRMMLIRLWIAEGLVEEKEGVTMEVVAGDYLKDLINRNMIQIAEFNRCYEIKSYRIHDLMREAIQSKCKEDYFSTTIIAGSQEGMRVQLHGKARRISIYHSSTGDENYNYSMGSSCSHIRSLMMFQLDDESPPRRFRDKFFTAFRSLKVLDLEGADLIEFPAELVELIHLRYLSLRGTPINLVPKSVGQLMNLQTLNLKQTRVSELPVEILKLQRLSHLLVYRLDIGLNSLKGYTYGVSVPTGIGNLTSLQKLAYLDLQHQSDVVMKELGKLTQLRRLGITNLRRRDGRDLSLALEKMKLLNSLDLVTVRSRTTTKQPDVNEREEEEEFLEFGSLRSPPKLLCHLYLQGRLMGLPIWIASLRNLTILGLRYSRLSRGEDPLKAFQHMPNLVHLHLVQAYDGEELCCSEMGGYKKLKKLFLSEMEKLKRVRLMEGSMPMLRELDIEICPELEMMPQGIEHLTGLQELRLFRMPPRLVNRIRRRRILLGTPQEAQPSQRIGTGPRTAALQPEAQGGGGEDCWSVQHIPKIINILHQFSQVVHENLQGSSGDPSYSTPILPPLPISI